MLHLPKFEYIRARSMEEVSRALSDYGPEACVIAGGTELLPRMKRGITKGRVLIDLKGVKELGRIEERDERLLIGTNVTLTELERSKKILEIASLLSQAASRVGVTQIRNMGTIGGNLCQETRCWYYNQSRFWRSVNPPCFKRGGDRCYVVKGGDHCYAMFCGDITPALICLNGSAILKSKEGERTFSLEDLYTGNGKEPLDIQSGEFLSHVALPENPLTEGVYLKLTMRQTGGFPIVGLAAAIQRSDGICRKSRIAVTSIESRPIRLKKVERLLEGKELKRPLLEEATKIAPEEVHPVTAMGIGAAYRRKMVGVMVRKALETLS